MDDATQPVSSAGISRLIPSIFPPPRTLLVSIIVPARNEESCIGDCLASLASQTGIACKIDIEIEIIVVDDGSTDRTRVIAESFAGVRVINAPPLPLGWIGKNNAVAAGAAIAHGEWLLFTDADTHHHPGSLHRALVEATHHGAQMLSYSPQQEVHGFWEQAVMPVVFGELAATYIPSEVSNPSSPAAAANGQYLLITRAAYDAVGGHAAVASEVLEDVALARRVKAAGYKIFFRYAADAVRTRMYRSFSQLKEGWIKNLALLFPDTLALARRRSLEFLIIVDGALLAIILAVLGFGRLAFLALFLACLRYFIFLNRIRRANFSWRANLFALCGLPIFAQLLRRSAIQWSGDGVLWKGRRYARPDAATLSAPANSASQPFPALASVEEKHGLPDPQG